MSERSERRDLIGRKCSNGLTSLDRTCRNSLYNRHEREKGNGEGESKHVERKKKEGDVQQLE